MNTNLREIKKVQRLPQQTHASGYSYRVQLKCGHWMEKPKCELFRNSGQLAQRLLCRQCRDAAIRKEKREAATAALTASGTIPASS